MKGIAHSFKDEVLTTSKLFFHIIAVFQRSRCKDTNLFFGNVSLCQSMSVCVSLCHFMSLSDLLPLSRCKDTKRKFGTVTFCHYLSPFVTFQQIAFSCCKVTKRKFGTVQLCPFVSIYVQLRYGNASFLFRCKVTKSKFGNVQICPILSIKFLSNSTFPLNCLVFALFYIVRVKGFTLISQNQRKSYDSIILHWH